MYTIKVANDPRTQNRIVVYRPSKNIITQNELIFQWEKKCGQNFHKTFIPEDKIVKLSQSKICLICFIHFLTLYEILTIGVYKYKTYYILISHYKPISFSLKL